jgi:hypothetical protein
VPIVVVPLIVVIKLFPDPSVAAADVCAAVLARSEEIEVGRDCPLAGIGMMLVVEALDTAATLVCDAADPSLSVVELAAPPVEKANDEVAAALVAIEELAKDSVVEPSATACVDAVEDDSATDSLVVAAV